MLAGRLDREVDILESAGSQDDTGDDRRTWSVVATIWAEKQDLAGKTFFAARQDNSEITTRFRMRWRTGLSADNRLRYDGVDYEIVSVAELGRRDGLEVMTRARVGQS